MQQKIFLIDGFGALLSALFLWIISNYEHIFGISQNIIFSLLILPILFSVYSFYNYFFIKKNWQLFLKIIAILNIFYCILTLFLVVLHFNSLTFLGVLYFVLESVIIIILASIELKIALK